MSRKALNRKLVCVYMDVKIDREYITIDVNRLVGKQINEVSSACRDMFSLSFHLNAICHIKISVWAEMAIM